MKATVVVLSSLAILFCASPLVQAQQGSAPYEGVVTGSDVYVRSGPGMSSYPVTKLGSPARVTVVERLSNGWLAIQPVKGCYGVVSAKYLQPDAAGKIGTFLGDDVFIRAAGPLRKKNFDNPLGKRNRGDRVRILGRVTQAGQVEWYIVKPPSDLRFYILGKYVRPADGSTPPEPAEPPTPEEETLTVLRPAPAPADVEAPVRKELDALRAIRALEKELVAETAKPVSQRDFKDILAKAEGIQLPPNSRFAPIYESLMQYIREETALVEKTRATDRMVDEVLRQAARRRAATAGHVSPEIPSETPDADRPFDLQGVLTISALYTVADPNQPKRYVVRDPRTQSPIGYVQSTGGKVDLSAYEGKNIGLRGRQTFDDSISLKILEVDSVTPLEETTAPKKPAPAEPPAPAEQPEPEDVEPELSVPAEKPEPTPVEPEPMEVESPEPAEEPQPLESAKPEPATPVEEPEAPEPVTPEPAEEEPAEIIPPEPVTPEPAEEEPEAPEPVTPEPAEEEPAEIIPPEPVTPEPAEEEPAGIIPPEPVTPEPAEEEPESPDTEIGPTPVKKPVESEAPPEPEEIESKPEPREAPPENVDRTKLQPMRIEPVRDIKPVEVEASELPESPAGVPSPKAADPKPMPAEQTPRPEPSEKMFEVEAVEGEVEVEWD